MKIRMSFFGYLFLFILFALPSRTFGEISGNQDVSVIYYHVDGNTQNSFYPKNDVDYLWEGNIDFSGASFLTKELFGSISYRATDDRLVDTQDISLEKLFIGLRGDAFEFLVGDFYSNFSEYSLGNGLKGVKIELGSEEGGHFKIVAGVDTTKWEDFWEERCEDSATRKYVWGFQVGNSFLDKKLKLNLNYGGSLDEKAYLSTSSAQLFVNVISINGDFLINDALSSSFEVAHSFTDEDKRLDEIKTKDDSAFKLSFDFNAQKYTCSLLYSRLGSHFNTTGGFTSSDLETISFDGTWFLPANVKFGHYITLDRDNLSKHSLTTTKQINPGAKFSFTLFGDTNCDIGFDLRKRFSTDKSTNEKTYTYSLNLSKDYRIVYANLGYTKTIVVNKIDPSQERDIDTLSLGLDGNFSIKSVNVNWNISEDLNHESYKDICEADLTLSHSLGVRMEFPSSLSIEAKATISDNDYYLNTSDSNTTDYYFSISRKLRDNLSFSVIYEHKGYNYADPDNNYAETIITGKLNYRF